ncbi:MAG TPA: hypothetical protein PL152_06700 [Steroidobacteraceae bacterium]|nr:hypothetical protein [Steroidobacteraceae bacterium]HQR49006.1 hypothetical protein [Steroidobacteraceae bacterium]
MSKPTLYYHVGSHKTGTTAIQQTLLAAAPDLRRQGICWPVLGPSRAHSRLVRAAYAWGLQGRVKANWLAARVRWQSRGMRATVLSSEKIYRIGYEFFEQAVQDTPGNRARRIAVLHRLRDLFSDDFDVRVLLYLRRLDEFAESMFKELLFRKPYAGRFLFDDFLAEQAMLFDYAGQARELEQHLGPVSLLSYDAARRSGLIAHFCAQIGAASPRSADADPRVRRSASNTAALFLERLAGERAVSHADRLRLLDYTLAGGLPDPPGRMRSLWASRDALEAFMQRYRDPALDHLFPAIDWDRVQFGPLGDAEFQACRAAFDAWRPERV